MLNKYLKLILIILFAVTIFTRVYNLDWGSPYFFHPDERNIAYGIGNLNLENNLNPKFFAYGSLPIYSVFFSIIPIKILTECKLSPNCTVNFEQIIIGLRLLSSVLSIALIPLIYYLTKKFFGLKTALITTFLSIFSTGLIQFSHFGTFESWTIYFSTILLFLSLEILYGRISTKAIILTGIVSGILSSIKISNLTLTVIPVLILGYLFFQGNIGSSSNIKQLTKNIIIYFLSLILIFIITNPFTFIDYESFRSSMNYETSVATGALVVFYTGEFFNTIPFVFQFQKVIPFLINPLLTILLLASIPYLIYSRLENKKNFYIVFIFLVLSLVPQSVLFVKWTRYVATSLPFIYIILGVFISDIYSRIKKKNLVLSKILLSSILLASVVFSLAYFITVFMNPDPRIKAAEFAKKNIPLDSKILSESFDLGIIAFNNDFKYIKLINFYDLDSVDPKNNLINLSQNLDYNQYLILPSQRVLSTRLNNQEKFPNGFDFYSNLSNRSKYTLIYESNCNLLCKITYLGNHSDRFEQTSNTFDYPPVRIYKINER